jgi:hypothetical protein
MARTSTKIMRFGIAGGLLTLALAAGLGAASFGELRVGAGEMNIHLGRGQEGLRIEVQIRACTDICGLGLTWKRANPQTLVLN